MDKVALVLGATGGIGGEVARVLLARGWQVKALHRAPECVAKSGDGLQWLSGDAMEHDDVLARRAGRAVDCACGESAGLSQLGPIGAADAGEYDGSGTR